MVPFSIRSSRYSLLTCYHAYLYIHTFRQARYLHSFARGCIVFKVAAVHLVYCSKLSHVHQEYGALNDIREAHTSFSQYRGQVLHHLCCLCFYVSLYQFTCGRIDGDLSGYEQHVAVLYRLVIWPYWRWRVACVDYLLFHIQM
jgi:hypothetical protein